MYLEILQNSKENTCARASFLIKLRAWEISSNIYFYSTPLVAASELIQLYFLEIIIR